MERVKSALEKAMEKAAAMGEPTLEEKATMKHEEQLKALLADFYNYRLTRDDLWQKLKGSEPSLLREAQQNLVDSMRIGSEPEEFQLRKDGILAIESLKERRGAPAVEHALSTIESLRKEYRKTREQAIEEVRAQVEANPKMRLRPVRTPDGRTVLQAGLSVDEAVQQRLGDFLTEHEKRYEAKFAQVVEKLRRDLR